MGLEENIDAEDIQTSLRKKRRKELFARTVGIGSFLTVLTHMESPVVQELLQRHLPFSRALDPILLPYHQESLFLSAAIGGLLYGTTSMAQRLAFNPLRPSNWKCIQQGFMSMLRGFSSRLFDKPEFRNLEDEKIFITKCLHAATDPLAQRDYQIQLHLIDEHYEQALQKTLPLMKAYAASRPPRNLVEQFQLTLTQLVEFYLCGKTEREAHYLVAGAIRNLAAGHFQRSKTYFTKALQLAPTNIPLHSLGGYFLEMHRDHVAQYQAPAKRELLTTEAQHHWQKTVELLLADPKTASRFRRLGNSRNEVVVVSGEGIVQSSFVFKRSPDKEHLEKEYTLTRKLDAIFEGSDTVVQALAFLSKDDLYYCILKRIAGISFVERFLTGDSATTLDQVLPFLAQFHDRLRTQSDKLPEDLLKRRDYGKFLQETYVKRMHLPPSPALTKALDYLNQQLDAQQRQPIHGDLHPENILASTNQFTIIDPEHMGIASPYLDLAAFLEHDALGLSAGTRERSLQTYYDASETRRGSFEQVRLAYLQGVLFRMLQVRAALERQVYSTSLEHQQQLQQHYEHRALETIRDMGMLDKGIKDQGLESLLLTH
ncbi:MAG: aminoglycoside phosphotransferase family protein [Candidatus Woesearchaeota archaeon]|nr:aminoglycoside phosphotransferase family protein [Candidatus Woesearchaeota archaeon]